LSHTKDSQQTYYVVGSGAGDFLRSMVLPLSVGEDGHRLAYPVAVTLVCPRSLRLGCPEPELAAYDDHVDVAAGPSLGLVPGDSEVGL
jgi:hypothetical protein